MLATIITGIVSLISLIIGFTLFLGKVCNAISQILKCVDDLKEHVGYFKKIFNFAKKITKHFFKMLSYFFQSFMNF
ncbi:hypothetical protein DY052_06130 [Apilactobacillus timberlakei]|nr:hypothetical protein DY052_06130 [Apilactobacillus timberlakei]